MDIVTRLRNHALPDPHDEREVMHAPLLREAADEIERMRRDHETWVAKCCDANRQIMLLSRQIESARIALTPNAKGVGLAGIIGESRTTDGLCPGD